MSSFFHNHCRTVDYFCLLAKKKMAMAHWPTMQQSSKSFLFNESRYLTLTRDGVTAWQSHNSWALQITWSEEKWSNVVTTHGSEIWQYIFPFVKYHLCLFGSRYLTGLMYSNRVAPGVFFTNRGQYCRLILTLQTMTHCRDMIEI